LGTGKEDKDSKEGTLIWQVLGSQREEFQATLLKALHGAESHFAYAHTGSAVLYAE